MLSKTPFHLLLGAAHQLWRYLRVLIRARVRLCKLLPLMHLKGGLKFTFFNDPLKIIVKTFV